MKFYFKSFIIGEIIVFLLSVLLVGLEIGSNNVWKGIYTKFYDPNLLCLSSSVPFECGWSPGSFMLINLILFTFINCIVQLALYASKTKQNIVIPNYLVIFIVILLTICGFFFLSLLGR